jgi:hypothetical protein
LREARIPVNHRRQAAAGGPDLDPIQWGRTADATAEVYQYSNANLNAIVLEAGVSETPPSGSGTASTIGNYTFPAQSITLSVAPN